MVLTTDKATIRKYTLITTGVLLATLGALIAGWRQHYESDSSGLMIIILLSLMLVAGVTMVRNKNRNAQRQLVDKVAFNATLISLVVFVIFAVVASTREESGLLSWALLLGGVFIVIPFCVIASHLIASVIIGRSERRH